ncbi:hypothetical protein [Cryobacterium sp. GrIS_2_6]|nr:hypothetical protein [Cryobacterium psychrotolerans]
MRPIASLPGPEGDQPVALTGEEPWLTTEDRFHYLGAAAAQSPNEPAEES